MPISRQECDVTGTVNLESVDEVTEASCHALHGAFGALGAGEDFLRQGFKDLQNAFWGKYPGLLHCDTPYHDLRHSLDTALVVARLASGWKKDGRPDLDKDGAVLAVLLGLFHDIGFIRRTGEDHLLGAQLLREHEERSVYFMRGYLLRTALGDLSAKADLIHATNFSRPFAECVSRCSPAEVVIARMVGSADLISQVADRFYLERCRDFLYREFAIAGADRTRTPNGDTVLLYENGDDLLAKTPEFYENLVRRRLENDFQNIDAVLAIHFGGQDHYRESMQRNLAYLTRLIGGGDLVEGLRRHPVPLLPTAVAHS